MDIFAERIKELRLTQAISQTALANHIGLTQRAIGFYETADKKPDYENLVKIADFFDVSTDYLTGRSDNPKQHLL